METCFNYVDKDTAFFSSDERRWINKIHKLKKLRPQEVEILAEPENNDGCIYCKLPVRYFKLQPRREYTEEERAAMSERLTAARSNIAE